MNHKSIKILITLALLLALNIGCSSKQPQKIILTVGHNTSSSYHFHKGLEYFANKVAEKTQGELQIQIIPDFDLNNGSDLIDIFKESKLNLALIASSDLSDILPQIMLFDLPYLFKNRSQAYRVLDGATGNYISRLLFEKGMRSLCYFENGFRHISTTRKVVLKPQDLKKLDIGTANNKISELIFAAFNASTEAIPIKILASNLKSGKIEGQDNPAALLWDSGLYQYQPYLSITKHAYSPALLLIDNKAFEKLSKKHEKALKEAAEEAKNYERLLSALAEEETLGKLADKGIKITWPDTSEFKKVLSPLFQKAAQKIGAGNLKTGAKLINSALENK